MAEHAFCVVGLGPHARNKLIPALIASGQRIAGVVTSGPDDAGTGACMFRSLEDAVAKLDAVFLLATPPALHAAQVRLALEAGRDVIVEKPAFVTRRETEELISLAARKGCVLLEAFMHRYTALYALACAIWSVEKDDIVAVETAFLVPEGAGGTSFRTNMDIASSIVFDIGCYPISLLADLGLSEVPLAVAAVDAAGRLSHERMHIRGEAGGRAVDINIGMNQSYENVLRYCYRDGSVRSFAPFYFGRPGARSMTTRRGTAEQVEELHQDNAFEIMLSASRADWTETARRYGPRMPGVAAELERLGAELLKAREIASIRRENL